MAEDWSDILIDGMIMDCSTISVNYATNGLATISFTVYTPQADGVPYDSDGPGFNMCIGGVQFTGWITEMRLSPSNELEFFEWSVSAQGIGCKSSDCSQGC
jgi:hypothetical protein